MLQGGCYVVVDQTLEEGAKTSVWNEVTHESNLTPIYNANAFNGNDLNAAINSAMEAASLEALSSYDILTDVAESREIPRLVTSTSKDLIKIIKTLKRRYSYSDLKAAANITPLALLKASTRSLRKLGSEWMAYRYGLMPLVYSYRDIVKTVNRGQSVRNRKTILVSPRPNSSSPPSSSTSYKWAEIIGDYRVSANVFQYFSFSDNWAQFAGIGFNPLVTAWELIPYSFVIDWFVNVGNQIALNTTLPLSRTRYSSYSIRRKTLKKIWVHYPMSDKTVTFGNVLPTNWVGTTPPATPSRTIPRPNEDQLLQTVETDSYSRTLFGLTDARLTISPNLNWRRLIDSAAMANNLLRAFSKLFKR
jgi:hypothetical protein